MPISHQERLESLKALLEQDPKDAFIRYGLADSYYKTGQYAECVEQIEAYLKLADDEGAVYRIWGKSLLKLGRIEEARQAFTLGIAAAERHSHPSMAEEYQETLELDFD